MLLLLLFALGISASYVPGTPGAVWSREEVEIVRGKVKEMINWNNWKKGGSFRTDGTFTVNGSISFEKKFCPDCLWGFEDWSKPNVPTTAKLLRLSFHDCVPYLTGEGEVRGGCDGCINWSGMGHGYSGFPGGPVIRDYAPVNKGDNNGLATTVAALEMIYTNKEWPLTAPALGQSLVETGKSRADLWQFAGIVALEVEIEKANFACDYDYNVGNQVRLLESEEKCYFKLFKPSVFKFGRVDCIPDETKKVTTFPYESTDPESHPNNYGSAKHVVDSLKHDFNLTAREGISLMAAHATSPQFHNFRLPTKYQWPGNPYLSNMYFKYLAGTGMYRRGNGLKPMGAVSVGDPQGRPNMGTLWKVHCMKIWKSNMTENGWGGPCFWRPTNGGCNRLGEQRSKDCFDHFASDGSIVLKSGMKDRNKICKTKDIQYDKNRIQRYGNDEPSTAKQGCGFELTFALTYEVNLMNDFQLDEEFRPHGCNGSLDKMLWFKYAEETAGQRNYESTVNCPPNMERYENGEALSEITTAFGEDHDAWNKAFLEGWEKFVENGYDEDELVVGPEYSWLGYSNIGSLESASFPLVFTENKKANPKISGTAGHFEGMTLRSVCLKMDPSKCLSKFRHDHEAYYLGRLESPWGCDEDGSTIESIPLTIRNMKDGKVLQINRETGNIEIAEPTDGDNQKWTFKPSCEGGVELTNIDTLTTSRWTYDPVYKTMESGDGFAKSSKQNGLVWWQEVQFVSGTKNPWLSMQWEIIRE